MYMKDGEKDCVTEVVNVYLSTVDRRNNRQTDRRAVTPHHTHTHNTQHTINTLTLYRYTVNCTVQSLYRFRRNRRNKRNKRNGSYRRTYIHRYQKEQGRPERSIALK